MKGFIDYDGHTQACIQLKKDMKETFGLELTDIVATTSFDDTGKCSGIGFTMYRTHNEEEEMIIFNIPIATK